MIDPYIAINTNSGPQKINYWFGQKKAQYHMIIQLMMWLKVESAHEVIQQAISELYAKERNFRLSENTPKL